MNMYILTVMMNINTGYWHLVLCQVNAKDRSLVVCQAMKTLIMKTCTYQFLMQAIKKHKFIKELYQKCAFVLCQNGQVSLYQVS